MLKSLLLFVSSFTVVAVAASQATGVIKPGEPWLDNRGQLIQAHGGGILHLGNTWYWFGEDRSQTNAPDKRYVSCYSSTDLAHWTFRRQVVAMSAPEDIGPHFIVERPKVFYNAGTKQFVMYIHLDGPGHNESSGYKIARVAVLTSDTVDGDYKWVRSFRPLGLESRDIGQFVDDDGTPYLIFESRPSGGFYIASLSKDYLDVEKQVAFIHAPLEGGAIVHLGNLYYAVGSHLSGWQPNPNVYASAPSLAGPWSEFKNIAPPETNTYDSQSSMLIKIVGSKATSVIYVGDRWHPKELWNSSYIWMPMDLSSGQFQLPKPEPWTINIRTGKTTILSTHSSLSAGCHLLEDDLSGKLHIEQLARSDTWSAPAVASAATAPE